MPELRKQICRRLVCGDIFAGFDLSKHTLQSTSAGKMISANRSVTTKLSSASVTDVIPLIKTVRVSETR